MIIKKIAGESLERHLAIQLGITCQGNGSHAAFAKLVKDLEVSEFLSRFQHYLVLLTASIVISSERGASSRKPSISSMIVCISCCGT